MLLLYLHNLRTFKIEVIIKSTIFWDVSQTEYGRRLPVSDEHTTMQHHIPEDSTVILMLWEPSALMNFFIFGRNFTTVLILCTLKLLDITSKCHTTMVFVILDWWRVFLVNLWFTYQVSHVHPASKVR
jgi:hypothetical protein